MAKTDLSEFCLFILTHGRPDRVYTYGTLRRAGYTGPIYIVIDNEDATAEQYQERYGDSVVIFDKEAVANAIDEGDNFTDRRSIIYARNACFDIAKRLGYRYFAEFDDDYTYIEHRFDAYFYFDYKPVTDLDRVFSIYLDYYKSIPALSLAMSQGGDFIGGRDTTRFKDGVRLLRKSMNTIFCSTDRPYQFFGRINEDVNAYTHLGSQGHLFLTAPNIGIGQKTTQSNEGGMSGIYLDHGTYVKSFYTIMYSPSFVRIMLMGYRHLRLHHHISWRNAVPAILRETHQKPRARTRKRAV